MTYLRHRKFPFFWSKEVGFDFGRYDRLAAQADYFGVDRLKKWISDRKYEAVVSFKKPITADTLLDPTPGDRLDIRPDEKLVRIHWSV